jgi:small-conductance mechanosensitive channel
VNIPFTAFAFLGGTLAIGIGFGAQTLIKNFISGIILMLERPIQVGDLIEVDNVTGKIQRIGLRTSVIEHFDGIETLVPNSVLLESLVDNWTFGKTALRGSVSVGVAYGSSTRETSRALLATALEHGQVLDRPEPEVRFDDFGDSSMEFRLLYWVDASKTQRDRLASDLRFMIEKALNEAGITISFPQRDIHIDSSEPLWIRSEESI